MESIIANVILTAVLAVIVAAAVIYVVKAKKSGAKCIGCPHSGACSKNAEKNSSCACGCSTIKK